MNYRYVPFLRCKRGERQGVKNLNTLTKQGISPIFILDSENYKGQKETKNNPAITPAAHITKELFSIMGSISFYIDGSRLGHSGASLPLHNIANEARLQNLNLIPATRLTSDPVYQKIVQNIAAIDQRGVALIVDLGEFASASGWISAWPFSLRETDLIIDFSNNISTILGILPGIIPLFQSLYKGDQWRSVTIAGSSMPENFVGFPQGEHKIKRAEWELWKKMTTADLAYRLDYGDYCTVPVISPPTGIRWGFPINVRYTLEDEFLICRGVRTIGPTAVDMDIQLVDHAQKIVSCTERVRIKCWGDDRVDNIAGGQEGPQNLEHWVKIGVNRHITITRQHLP